MSREDEIRNGKLNEEEAGETSASSSDILPASDQADDPSLDEDIQATGSEDSDAEDGPVAEDASDDISADEALAKVVAEDADSDDPAAYGEEDEDDLDDDEEDDEEEGGNMSLLEHLDELRKRLTRCFIGIGIGFVACYGFAEQMFDILMKPMAEVLKKVAVQQSVLPPDFFVNFRQALGQAFQGTDFRYDDKLDIFVDALKESLGSITYGGHFQYTYPAEAFFAHIKIAVVAGIFLMSPYLFAQIWGFVAPGLYDHERKWIVPMAIVSALFFVSGGLFGYFVVFPYGFDFFASFATTEIAFTPKLSEYLSFCLKLLFAFGIVFELPLFIFFLARLGLVTAKGLRAKQKYAILVSFIVAAILTPPDPFTQTLMAGPLIILYEVGIWVAYLFGKKPKKEEAEPEESEAEEPKADEIVISVPDAKE